ncbi:hypothetical protein RB250 [Rhodopirellula baltica SH 1]|uniref:Uncharacterized protein n=1 Tax=Rhodopirellula baltica (strain DSM 10527 / NCIMB 13988 / SH1) TaxID=243090 RepID=Q7UZ21_RHOBA|nr:hypothetical protein RB250 [Rhodopirellula baltica SH 1]
MIRENRVFLTQPDPFLTEVFQLVGRGIRLLHFKGSSAKHHKSRPQNRSRRCPLGLVSGSPQRTPGDAWGYLRAAPLGRRTEQVPTS